jgi:hypothetical protein
MTDIQAEPRMVVFPGTDPDLSRRIETIDRSIHRAPEEFQQALTELGSAALEGMVKLGNKEEKSRRIPKATRKAASLVTEYLENRYDFEHEYDDDTESALAGDEENRQLITAARNQRNELVKTGIMRTETRENPNALPAVEAARRYRFGVYLGRVAAHQAQQTTPHNLPSAG